MVQSSGIPTINLMLAGITQTKDIQAITIAVLKKKKVIIQFIHSLFSFAWRPALNKNTEAFNEE